jgi:hypothetical protein
MATLPLMQETEPGMDRIPETCPYSAAEIENYLFDWLHEDLSLVQEPVKLSGLRAEKRDADRCYWMFEAVTAELRGQWFVIVGSGGKSQFAPHHRMKRWVYAERNDEGLSPEAFLDKIYHEQPEAYAGSQ